MPSYRIVARSLAHVLLGPQLLAFVPAMALCAFWFGGEMMLITVAVVVPATLALITVFNTAAPKQPRLDSVTGLPFASHASAALDRHFAAADGQRIAAVAIELDGMTDTVARIGPGGSEALLAEAAARLTAALRPQDIVARKPSAGFVAVIGPVRALDLEAMIQLSARLQAAFEMPVEIDGLGLHVTLSVGFCLPRRKFEMCGEGCLAAAETALAEAQAAGPGNIRAYVPRTPVVSSSAEGLRRLGDELADAFERDEIGPFFQPQMSTDTGTVSGMEALVRWTHPDRGTIEPSQFLGAVAAAGLHRVLCDTMLRKGLAALADWDRAGLDVPGLSINFTGQDLADPLLIDRVKWELDRHGIAPHRLAVEILETVISRNDDDAVTRTVAGLAGLGCRIELDDFGTGHAAIANIRRFSVARIKIDRSFVARIDMDSAQRTMLAAILDMAARLGIETVAEGVETQGEHALLAQLGCHHVQGYSIARPMSQTAATDWLRAQVHDAAPVWPVPRTG